MDGGGRTRARRRARRAGVTRAKLLGYGIAVAALVVALVWVPLAAVFAAVVLLNFVYGGRENVPFSRYSMFSTPSTSAWSLRYEDDAGELVPIGRLGIDPQRTQKLFATIARAARRDGKTELDARRHAAQLLADEIQRRRPHQGRLATTTVNIVYVEYDLNDRGVEVTRTPLVAADPL